MKPEVLKPEDAALPVEKYPTPEKPREVETVLAMRRDELKPEVRKYADNLQTQILEIYKEFGVENDQAFEAAARAGNVPIEKLRDLVTLTTKLAEVSETGEAKEVTKAIRFINLAKETVTKIEGADFDLHYRAEAYATIARVEQQAGLEFNQSLQQAKIEADRLKSEGEQSKVYLDIIGSELAAGKFDQAEDTAKRIKVDRRRELANLGIVLARGGADRFERAEAIAEGIKIGDDESDYEKKFFPYAFANIALAQAKAGQDPTQSFEKALVTARKLKDKKYPLVTPKTYLYLIRTEAEAGRFYLAKKTSEELTDSAAVRALADIALAEAKAGQEYHATIQLANKAANKIKSDDYWERRVGFSHLARTEARLGDFDGARITVQGLDTATFALCLTDIALIESETGHDPTYSLELAEAAARKIEEPTQGKLNTRLEAWVRIAEVEAEIGLDSTESLNQAKASFRKWDFKKDDAVWNPNFPLIQAEVKAGNIEQAKQMANELVADARSRAYTVIVHAQLHVGKFDQVEDLIKEIKRGFDLKGVAEDLAMAAAEKIKGGVIESDFLVDFPNFQAS